MIDWLIDLFLTMKCYNRRKNVVCMLCVVELVYLYLFCHCSLFFMFYCKNDFKNSSLEQNPAVQGLPPFSFSLRSLFYFWEREKKVFCFILLHMQINNIVTDDAGSRWLIFVKAKMWFGSQSSSSRSLILLCVWFLLSIFMILVWSPDLWIELYFCLIVLHAFSPPPAPSTGD